MGDPACGVSRGLSNNRTASGDSEPDHAAAGQGLFVLAVAGPGFEPGQAKPTEADILIPLAVIYAYVGRFADARDAISRAWSVHDRSGAKSRWPPGAGLAGHIEQIAGDPPAAGHAPRTSPHPPGLSWRCFKRRNDTGFPCIPSRLAHRARPIGQYQAETTSSRLLPPSPDQAASSSSPLLRERADGRPLTSLWSTSALRHTQATQVRALTKINTGRAGASC